MSKSKLLNLLVEGLLIIFSILLAFAIDAWWDDYKEEIVEEKLLTNLQKDFSRNKELLTYTIARFNSSEQNVKGLMSYIRPGDINRNQQVPDSLVISLFTDWISYDPVLGTLNSAISSGKMGLIRNEQLRTELATWQDLVKDLKEGEKTDFSHRSLIQQEIFSYVALRSVGYRSVGGFFDRESTVKTDYAKLTNSLNLENILADRLGQLNTTQREASIVMSSLDKILEMIRQELDN